MTEDTYAKAMEALLNIEKCVNKAIVQLEALEAEELSEQGVVLYD